VNECNGDVSPVSLVVPKDSASFFSHSLALSFLPVSLCFGDCTP
jgi:hypothetical protein